MLYTDITYNMILEISRSQENIYTLLHLCEKSIQIYRGRNLGHWLPGPSLEGQKEVRVMTRY